MHIIYLVRKDNTPVYVGYTSQSIEQRWKEHIYESIKRPKYPLHHAIKKYGVDSFTIEPIYESEDKYHTLNHMEHHYIWLYRTHIKHGSGGYNLTFGGEGCSKSLTKNDIKIYHKIYNKARYEANKEKVKAQRRAEYQANKEKVKAKRRAWRAENKEKIKFQRKALREAKSAAWVSHP